MERLVELGMTPDDAEALIEFEHYVHDRSVAPSTLSADRQPVASENPPDTPQAGEQQAHYRPRIYVTDVAGQQHGVAHSQWIDAAQDRDDLEGDIATMLDNSPTPPRLPWTQAYVVQATAEFAGLNLHGFTDTALIAELARGVAEHGAAYAAWVGMVGTADRDQLAQFEDFYVGSYDNPEAWARTVAEDLDWHGQLDREITDPFLRRYVVIDYAKVAREAADGWDVVTGTDGRTHVFLR